MKPDNDNPPTPEANSPGQPQQPQSATPPQGNVVQPSAQYGSAEPITQPTAQSQESSNTAQSFGSVQQVSGQQIQTQQSKSKAPIIIAVLVVVLLIGGLLGFLVIGLNSDNEESRLSGAQDETESSSVNPVVNDMQRKLDVAKFIAEAVTFQANNNGKVPTFEEARTELIPEYVLHDDESGEFNDPTTNAQYSVVDTTPEIGEIQYAEASACSGDEIVPASSRQAAARTLLESGEFYCVSP